MLYLDANASEPLRPEARAAMLAALSVTGNPSSVHGAGRAARRVLEDAREAIAGRFGGRPADLVFTSGGTEADALAIHALAAGRRVIIGATEHDAVRSAAPDAAILPVDRSGRVDLDRLAEWLADTTADSSMRAPGNGAPADSRPALVCLMLANNETGTIQPIAAASELCRRFGAWLHVDAVQAAGRMPVALDTLGAHSLALSSHKLGGPTGAGALLLAREVSALTPLIAGGGQERGRRGGTPPLAAIAGFAAAAAAPPPAEQARLRDAIEQAALTCGAIVCGAGAPRLDNTTCLALPGVRADGQVIALDLEGIAVSAGAACSSGKVATSHVLQAMGLGPLAGQAIRISLPWNVQPDVAAVLAPAYRRMAERLRATLAGPAGVTPMLAAPMLGGPTLADRMLDGPMPGGPLAQRTG